MFKKGVGVMKDMDKIDELVKQQLNHVFSAIEEDLMPWENKEDWDLSIFCSDKLFNDKNGALIRYFRRHKAFICNQGKFGDDFKNYKECNNCFNYFHCSIVYNE